MKINWKVRFKNKVWLTTFISLIVGFVYNILACFDIFPKVTQNTIMQIIGEVLTFLGLIGVIVDPTTAGIEDSNRAMSYQEPWVDVDPVVAAGMDPDPEDQPCPPMPKGEA